MVSSSKQRSLHLGTCILWFLYCGHHVWSFSITTAGRSSIQHPPCTGTTILARQRRDYDADEYNDDDYYYEDEDPQRKRVHLNVDMDEFYDNDEQEPAQQQHGSGVYNVYFEGTNTDLQLDWEQNDDGTWVLLPPPYAEMPRAVVHFVGGTFFGSSPKYWYRTLLEGICRATQCCIVATPIPVTLLKNPLQHVNLSKKLRRQFQSAYTNILMDEYDAEELQQEVPVIGMAHSLGARLLVILSTLSQKRSVVPPYQAMVLMSFTNYGSAASIPGIQSLLQESKRIEHEEQVLEDGFRRNDQDVRRNKQRQRRRDYDYDDDDDYDEEWEELMEDFSSTLKEQADRLKTALTPRSRELEFYPTPNQLWKAIKNDGRYQIPQTLVVQFDDDLVDQSPRLTECIRNSSDVKYCRLRGMHLTPVSVQGEEQSKEEGSFLLGELPERASQIVWKLIRGSSTRLHNRDAIRDLRQSIARYITDEVAK